LREQLLDRVRTALVAEGKLGAEEIRLPTLENLNMTREQMRSVNSYAAGLVLDVHRDTPAIGLERGSYAVLSADPKTREVTVADDKGEHRFRPEKLHPNGNGVSLSRPSEISVRTGDTLQWTANDKRVGATNGQTVRLDAVDGQTITLTNHAGKAIKLDADDPMRQRLGHGLVLNMHKAQGLTVENAITVMSSNDRMLNTQSLAYVLASRAREGIALHVDSREKLIGQIEANSGLKASALDSVAEQPKAKEAEKVAAPEKAVEAQTERFAKETKALEKEITLPVPEKYLGMSL
jgi:plastocyanin